MSSHFFLIALILSFPLVLFLRKVFYGSLKGRFYINANPCTFTCLTVYCDLVSGMTVRILNKIIGNSVYFAQIPRQSY